MSRPCSYAVAFFATTVAALAQQFVDVTDASGLGGVAQTPTLFGDGICCGDFDGDRDLDILVTGRVGDPVRYFRNSGGMQFVELDAAALGFGPSGGNRAATAADIDNDGDLDIFLGSYQAPVQLYINDGTGSFTEEASGRGLFHIASNYAATFGDYDLDGWLDLFIGNRDVPAGLTTPEHDILYRNVGGGSFVVELLVPSAAAPRSTFVASFFDYNEDFYPDLFIGGDKGQQYGGNQLFENQGDGTFADVSVARGVDDEIDAMGFDFVDVFNDGGLDFYVSDLPIDHLFHVWLPDVGNFRDESGLRGVQGGYVGWAVQFADFENDGWQDIHVVHSTGPNTIFRNPGPGTGFIDWLDVPYGLDDLGQTSAVVADFDGDGRVDVLNRLVGSAADRGLVMQRNVTDAGNWLQIDCVGTRSNRDGLGARVEVFVDGGPTQRQYVRSGAGFMAGNPKTLNFGLADAASVRLRVSWPSGQVQELGPVLANQRIELHEPTLVVRGEPRRGGLCRLRFESPHDAGSHYLILLAGQDLPRTPLGDGRELAVAFDTLSAATLVPGNGVLFGNLAALHRGAGEAALLIPDDPGVVGLGFWATGLTFVPGGPFATVLSHAERIVVEP